MSTLTFALAMFLLGCSINSEITKRAITSCPEDEILVECGYCGPRRCDELGFPIRCTGVSSACTPECVCNEGSVRGANGTCILKKDCPSCGKDLNATSGCGNHCGRMCSDYLDTNKTCLTGCRANGCDCREEYVFHEGLGHCILPKDCSLPSTYSMIPACSDYPTGKTGVNTCRVNEERVTSRCFPSTSCVIVKLTNDHNRD